MAFPHMELLTGMLAIPAISRKEEERASFVESFLSKRGWKVQRVHNNLLVGDPGAPGPKVLLNSHIDTVAPVEGWQSDPFRAVLEKGRLTGLGANDAGASVVSLASVFEALAPELDGKVNLLLLLSAEEEVSGKKGIEAVLPSLGTLDAVIVGEPTGMKPAVAERGLMVLDGETEGMAGHAAREEGVNAIYLAMEDFARIRDMDFPRKSEWLPNASAQVTLVSAGSQHNVVPDLCRFVVDVRSNDCYDNEALLEMIREHCSARLNPRSIRLKPSRLEEDHPLMCCVREGNMEAFGSSTMSDMALISAPALKMGPGNSARSHTAGEYILEKELEEGIRIYKDFLYRLSEKL